MSIFDNDITSKQQEIIFLYSEANSFSLRLCTYNGMSLLRKNLATYNI